MIRLLLPVLVLFGVRIENRESRIANQYATSFVHFLHSGASLSIENREWQPFSILRFAPPGEGGRWESLSVQGDWVNESGPGALILDSRFPILDSNPQQEEPTLRELIRLLREDSIDLREKAAEDLVNRGKAALPDLEKLRSSADPELRARVELILKSIGEQEILGRHWRRGPRISGAFEQVPASRVLEEIARQGKDPFEVDLEGFADRVSLTLEDATYWDALHALSRVAPVTWTIDGDRLVPAKGTRPPFPTRRQAEFMVWIDGMVLSREQDFSGNSRGFFSLGLVTAWERGISPVALEQRITEIADGQGNNLIGPDRGYYPVVRMESPKGRQRRDEFRYPIPAAAPEIGRIARIKGYSLLTFPRAYEEVSLELSPTPATAGRLDRLTLTIRNFRFLKNGCSLELLVTLTAGGGDSMSDRLPPQSITLIDDQGAEYVPSTSSRSMSYGGTSLTTHESVQVTLPEGRTPARLRVRILKDVLEKRISFEFTDLPVE